MKKIKIVLVLALLWVSAIEVHAQSKIAVQFDTGKMQFKGSKTEQAKYLLRYVKKYANLGDTLTQLPVFIDSLMQNKVRLPRKKKVQAYLDLKYLGNLEIGGALDSPICSVDGNKASYFVIHDTSNFLANATSFPNNLDSASWSGNRLDNKLTFKNAHLFINRLGASITSNDLSKPIRGTKFENPAKNPFIQKNILGTFIHIEVIQPRMADPGKQNDAIAINPGFTDAQYERLALIYTIASLRKGSWLVPTFHAVLDDGIPDGHDDPQNFDLLKFDQKLSALFHILSN